MRAIAENIRKYRKARGLTQLALAMRLGVTPQAVGKWEREESEPDISLLLPLARELNVSAEALLGAAEAGVSSFAPFLAEKLPESLKNRRLAAGLTQAELAQKLNVLPQTVSKWENGVCAPDIGYFGKLSALYDVSLSALLSEPAPAPPRPAARNAASNETPAAQATRPAAKRRRLFSSIPMRAASVALLLALLVSVVFTLPSFLGGTSSPPVLLLPSVPSVEAPAGDAEKPAGNAEQSGGEKDPTDEADPSGTQETPDDPPAAEEPTYHTLTVYSDVARFPETQTVWKDELVEEGWQLVFGAEADAKDGVLALPYECDGYTVTGYERADGTPVSFPVTVSQNIALYMQTEPLWLDWASRNSYSEQETLRLFCSELDVVYTFLESYIRFYEEFVKMKSAYPQMSKREIFLYLNDPARLCCFPSSETLLAGGKRLTLPLGHMPCGRGYPYLTVWDMQPETAAEFEAFCGEYIRIPTLQAAYALTQEDVPLEAAFVSAMKNFAPLVALAHESVTETYRDFMRGHADADAYEFPEITAA